MAEEYYVEPCEFTCAKKFLDTLDETNELWRGKTWLYRGQNVDKSLLPSALRTPPPEFIEKRIGPHLTQDSAAMLEDAPIPSRIATLCAEKIESFQNDEQHATLIERFLEKHFRRISGNQIETHLQYLDFREFWRNYILTTFYSLAERYMVRAFVELADQVGLIVPPDVNDTVWNKPFHFFDQISVAVADGNDLSLLSSEECTTISFALAQHHRVPTRLLDITYRPLVAAYFASHFEEEPVKDDPSRKLVVWAINAGGLRETDLKIVKRRRSEIGFLQAQDGAFLLDARANEKFWFEGRWLPFEYYLNDQVASSKAFKFSLPMSERKELLDRLELKGVSMPALMPSFDNVRRHILHERFDIQKFAAMRA